MLAAHPTSRRLGQILVTLLSCLAIASPIYARPEPEEVDDDVRAAETTFTSSLNAYKLALTQHITTTLKIETELAATRGDQNAVASLKAQLQAFETDGSLPTDPATREHIQAYQKQLSRLGDELIEAYKEAKTDYHRARDPESAKLMQTKIKWTRPTTGLSTVEFEGHRYMLVRKKTTWTQAQAACQELGGYLACISNRNEQRFIYSNFIRHQNTVAWVGATDAHNEGDWVWIDGNAGLWQWTKGEPNNAGKEPQNYGVINKIGLISDLAETDPRVNAYLIEWDHPPTREEIYVWDQDEEADEGDEDE